MEGILKEWRGTGAGSATPGRLLLGAGTVHKGLEMVDGVWNFDESLWGTTRGGCKLEIVPELTEIECDGQNVSAEGLLIKTGETATLEFSIVDPDLEKLRLLSGGTKGKTESGYTDLSSSSALAAGDYIDDLALVCGRPGGGMVIIRFDRAVCTSGLKLETKNRESAAIPVTMKCLAQPGETVLPWHVFYGNA